MKNKKVILGILGILLFVLWVNNDLGPVFFPSGSIDDKQEAGLISSGFWNLTGTPILIDDADPTKNWSYTASHFAWCSGSGTWETPYLIENVTIDGLGVGSCIEVRNSTAFFIIKNCSIYNPGSDTLEDGGITLRNTKNGQMKGNIINTSYKNGICLAKGNFNNTISKNSGEFHLILWESSNNTISNNSIFGEYGQIRVIYNSSYNMITKNEVIGGKFVGIELITSCNYNVIENNTVKDNTGSRGLKISGCRNNILFKNIVRNIGEHGSGIGWQSGGFTLTNINNTIISNNTIANVGNSGIAAIGYNNIIKNNDILDISGIGIWGDGNNITIKRNKLYRCLYWDALWLLSGNNNTISENSLTDNSGGMLVGGKDVVINDNYIYSAPSNGIRFGGTGLIFDNFIDIAGGAAISLYQSNNSVVWNNTLYFNKVGIFLEQPCYHNVIRNNNLTGEVHYSEFGIKISKSNNNNITNNIITSYQVALHLERSNYTNIIGNIMTLNLKCIEEIECIDTIYRDNSCDLDVISPTIMGFDVYIVMGVVGLFIMISVKKRCKRRF